jgi:hypothetical protein
MPTQITATFVNPPSQRNSPLITEMSLFDYSKVMTSKVRYG